MDAADWISLSIAAVAAATGIAALVVAVLSYNRSKDSIEQAKRSADQAERSADHAGDAVVEARRSADEAERMREIEAGRRADEKELRHEKLAPELPAEMEAVLGGRFLAPGGGELYGSIEVSRTYRVTAFGRAGASETPLAFPATTRPNEEMRFVIEPWPPARTRPSFEEIVFRFWPPVEGVDQGDMWSCNCGRPGGETMDGAGHWERRVKVNYYNAEDSVF